MVFVLPLLLFVLMDETARRSLRTPGPYVAAALFFRADRAAFLLAGRTIYFLPLQYADARARVATHWHHVLTFPLQWIASQVFFLAPRDRPGGVVLVSLSERRRLTTRLGFARRYVTVLGLGPFAVTTLLAIVFGRLPVAMWGYPLWSFAPLAALM